MLEKEVIIVYHGILSPVVAFVERWAKGLCHKFIILRGICIKMQVDINKCTYGKMAGEIDGWIDDRGIDR